jgi:hypothetical protein
MIKTFSISDYSWPESPFQLIKWSSRGLRGFDRSQFEKRAGRSILSELDHLQIGPGDHPAHLYAMGSTEAVGPNRNYDGFPKHACDKSHPTFVKYARFYREHASRDPAKSYGLVKASAFNDAMQRVELICVLNETKEAADRNGGLLADREMQKLARGEELGVSMGCRVALDFCSYCDNAAPSRASYCRSIDDGGHCKAGGLTRNIGRILADGHVLHAVNREPVFFDISHVNRPADRIAYITGSLRKSASVNTDDGVYILPPVSLLLDSVSCNLKLAEHVELLHKMACIEQELKPVSANLLQVCGSSQTVPMPKEASDNPRQALKALTEAGCILPLAGFLQLFGDQNEKEAAQSVDYIGDELGNCFSMSLNNGNLEEQLTNHNFKAATTTTPSLRKWAAELQTDLSLTQDAVKLRSMSGAVRNRQPEKLSSSLVKSAGVESVVAQYATYKSAAVLDIFPQTRNIALTATLAIIQNRIK